MKRIFVYNANGKILGMLTRMMDGSIRLQEVSHQHLGPRLEVAPVSGMEPLSAVLAVLEASAAAKSRENKGRNYRRSIWVCHRSDVPLA